MSREAYYQGGNSELNLEGVSRILHQLLTSQTSKTDPLQNMQAKQARPLAKTCLKTKGTGQVHR